MKRKRLAATINQIAGWERLNEKHASLSDKTVEILKYAESELIGPGMARAAKDGLLLELLSALRKRRKVTDSLRQARAAYNALMKDGQQRTFRNLKKKVKEMFPHSRLPDRTLREIVRNDHCLSRVICGRAGRPKSN
jgi:catalase